MQITPAKRLIAGLLALMLFLSAGAGLLATMASAADEETDPAEDEATEETQEADDEAAEDEDAATEEEGDDAEPADEDEAAQEDAEEPEPAEENDEEAADDEEAAFDLDVTIEHDGGGTIREGQEVTYTVSVTNNEDEDLANADIVHMLPPGFEHVSADPEGTPAGTQLTWSTSLEGGETAEFTHTVEVLEGAYASLQDQGESWIQVEQPDAPEGDDQFSSTACVYNADSPGDSLGCASSYDELGEAGLGTAAWVAIIAAAVLLLALIIAAILYFRSRGGSEDADEADADLAAADQKD